MGCSNCGSATLGEKPTGCRSNGSCMTGGCNRLNTFDWLASVPIPEDQRFNIVEVSFKHGSRKDFYRNSSQLDIMTGDLVVVESEGGYDVGRISLSGELVKMQMSKRRTSIRSRRDLPRVLRKARDKDLENLTDARAREGAVMIRARQLVRESGLNMKIGDVEYQGDLRKATFYYTSDDRVDFRDLIRDFAQEFRIKVDMRQIGARQEAGKIGGIGSCGRELCCSTWLTEFKSVSTSAARYQNLAINQSKLSGQCGRLKCCLNYELETYVEGMKAFPKGAKRLKTVDGEAVLQKSDLFKVLMYYSLPSSENMEQFALEPDRVREIMEMNERGELAPPLSGIAFVEAQVGPVEVEFVENAQVSLRTLERSSRKRRSGGKDGGRNGGRGSDGGRGGRGSDEGRAGGGRGSDGSGRAGGGRGSDGSGRAGGRPDDQQARGDRSRSTGRGGQDRRGGAGADGSGSAVSGERPLNPNQGDGGQGAGDSANRDKNRRNKRKKGPRPDGAGPENRERGDRPDRGDRPERDRPDREPRGDRPERDRPYREPRGDRPPRAERPDQGDRPPRTDGQPDGEGQGRGERRSRGGRRRGRGRGGNEGGQRGDGGNSGGGSPAAE